MKKFLPIFAICLILITSCNQTPYDDSDLKARIEQLENDNKNLNDRITALEESVNNNYSELTDELENIVKNYQTKSDCDYLINALGKKINAMKELLNNLDVFYATKEDLSDIDEVLDKKYATLDNLDTITKNLEGLQSSVDLLEHANTFKVDSSGSLLLFNGDGLLTGYILKELGSDNTSFQATMYNPIITASYDENSFIWVYGERNTDASEKYDNNITYYADEDYFVFKTQRNNTRAYKTSVYILLNKNNNKVTQHTITNLYAYQKHSNSYYYPGYYCNAKSLDEYISLFSTEEYLADSNYSIVTNEYSSWYSSNLAYFSSWSTYLNSAVEFYRKK